MEFVSEEESKKFEFQLHELMNFCKGKGRQKYHKTLMTLVTDNIKMFERIKELENEQGTRSEESK